MGGRSCFAGDKLAAIGRYSRTGMRVLEASMRPEQKPQSEPDRVVAFRPRSGSSQNRASRSEAPAEIGSMPVADLTKYQRTQEEDYRHRMVVNVLALAFCIVLAIAGVWLVDEIAEMKRIQDCVLSGRAGCVPLAIPLNRGR